MVIGAYGSKPKVRFVWILDEQDPKTGEPLLAVQSVNRSLNEQSSMYEIVTGLGVTVEVDEEFDLEKLEGTQVTLVIEHRRNPDGSRQYANVVKVEPGFKGQSIEVPFGWEPPKVKEKTAAGYKATDDDVPF